MTVASGLKWMASQSCHALDRSPAAYQPGGTFIERQYRQADLDEGKIDLAVQKKDNHQAPSNQRLGTG